MPNQVWSFFYEHLPLWSFCIVCLVAYLLKSHIPKYIEKKAENLATKEDIGEITEAVEAVKTRFAAELDDHLQKNRLARAAIDQRLKAYQEAYSLWQKIKCASNKGGTPLDDLIREAEDWIPNNCIYISDNARRAMISAKYAASIRSGLLNCPNNGEEREKNWQKIVDAGDIIMKSSELPGFSEEEKQELTKEAQP